MSHVSILWPCFLDSLCNYHVVEYFESSYHRKLVHRGVANLVVEFVGTAMPDRPDHGRTFRTGGLANLEPARWAEST